MHHQQSAQEEEVIDLELTCLHCHGRLYAPLSVTRRIIAEVESGKPVILLCPSCEWGNMLSAIRRQTRTND